MDPGPLHASTHTFTSPLSYTPSVTEPWIQSCSVSSSAHQRWLHQGLLHISNFQKEMNHGSHHQLLTIGPISLPMALQLNDMGWHSLDCEMSDWEFPTQYSAPYSTHMSQSKSMSPVVACVFSKRWKISSMQYDAFCMRSICPLKCPPITVSIHG